MVVLESPSGPGSVGTIMVHFHQRVRVGSVRKGAALLVSQYSVDNETIESVTASWSYTCRPLICRQVTSCDRGTITYKHSRLPARCFWTTAKASFIDENVAQKFDVLLGSPTLLLFVHFVAFSFSLGFTSRLHCGCYEVTMFMLLPCLSPSGLNPALP